MTTRATSIPIVFHCGTTLSIKPGVRCVTPSSVMPICIVLEAAAGPASASDSVAAKAATSVARR